MTPTTITPPPPPPPSPSSALVADGDLPICTLCGTQFPSQRDDCPICLDPRQWTAESGQSWTSLNILSQSHQVTIIPDRQDPRISFITTKPPVGIGQSPILIQTSNGSYIWDCSSCISPSLIQTLKSLPTPLKAIAISHPHFYASSLTWSRALSVPLFISKRDQSWFQRLKDVRDEINWFDEQVKLGDGIEVIRCGGHFPGSSILVWDRSLEPSSPTGLRSGIALVSDTLMVQPTQRGFTYQWSVPNMIPLGPQEIISLLRPIHRLQFDQATSTWPNRFIRKQAKELTYTSAERQFEAMGWEWEGDLKSGEGEFKVRHMEDFGGGDGGGDGGGGGGL